MVRAHSKCRRPVSDGTQRNLRRILVERLTSSEVALSQSDYTMNIFYIIGVIVVVVFVAGFLGLRV